MSEAYNGPMGKIRLWISDCKENIFTLENFMRDYEYAEIVIHALRIAKIETNNFEDGVESSEMKYTKEREVGRHRNGVTLYINFRKGSEWPTYLLRTRGLRYGYVYTKVIEDHGVPSRAARFFKLPIDLLELIEENE